MTPAIHYHHTVPRALASQTQITVANLGRQSSASISPCLLLFVRANSNQVEAEQTTLGQLPCNVRHYDAISGWQTVYGQVSAR